ncbi:MAG: M20 family metallo-hydrolase [Candidatus Bathyarchaeia archaeon]
MQSQEIFSEIQKQRSKMAQTLMELIRIPAIAPENGGEGELKKAEKLTQTLASIGFDKIERHDATDARVPSKLRPNIVAYYNGLDSAEKLWIVTHLDIVPPGEESMWTVTKPYEPKIKDERIYGRGSEDNTQSMIASIFAVKALKELGVRPKRTISLAFVADEEQGSKHGIQHLIKQNLFKPEDLIIVPDGGEGDGGFIEIAEKSALWFRIRTIGMQAHASRPGMGLNAHRVGMQFGVALDKRLHEKYSEKDKYFVPPESTIEPTKKEANVDAINIVPGEDVIYFDCRILPCYSLEDVISDINDLAKQFRSKTGADIKFEPVQKTVAPKPTDAKAKIVKMLAEAVRTVRKVEPRIGGIGGGTCAAYFRRIGVPAVVWSTIDETAHQPDEYAKIENLVNDTKVYACLAMM